MNKKVLVIDSDHFRPQNAKKKWGGGNRKHSKD